MNFKISIRKLNEKLINLLLIITPCIDLFNGFFEYILDSNMSPGVAIRSVILILIIITFILQNRYNIIKFILIISIFIIQLLIISNKENFSLYSEISFISKLYYNVFLMFIIYKMSMNKQINNYEYIDKLIKANIIINISFIVTKILGIGVNSYGDAGGYKGLYMGLNDVTAVLTITFPFILYKISNSEKKLAYGIFATISAVNIIMLGTKTSMVLLVITGIFFVYQLFFKEKKIVNKVLIIFVIVIFFIIFKRYFWDTYSSTILTRLKYFGERQSFGTFLVSGRNETLVKSFELWNNNIFNIIFGIGFSVGGNFISSFLPGHVMIEMDLFDIIYFYGISMLLIIYIPLFKVLIKSIGLFIKSKNLLYKTISLVYILTFIISFLGGHVILSPLAGIYFFVIYGMVKVIK